MGRFKTWMQGNVDHGRLRAAQTADLVEELWGEFVDINFAMFDSFRRSRASGATSTADINPATRINTARNGGAFGPLRAALITDLDNYADHVYGVSRGQDALEAAQLHANRMALREPAEAGDGGGRGTGALPTVRLQVQTNFKMKKGEDTIATESVSNGGGVSATSIDAAFERMVTATGFNTKLVAQLRECYTMHKARWLTYTVGNSYSINFDADTIKVGGRPKSGYRFDIENLRVGDTPNFR